MKNINVNTKLTKPFLKWDGGKLRIVDKLKIHFVNKPGYCQYIIHYSIIAGINYAIIVFI